MRALRARWVPQEGTVEKEYLSDAWRDIHNAQCNINLERPDWVIGENIPDKLFEVEPQPQRHKILAPASTKATYSGGCRVVGMPDVEDLIGWKLHHLQKEVILSDAHTIVLRAARRWGKDVCSTLKALYECMRRVGTAAIIYPSEKQAMESIAFGHTVDGERTIEKLIPRCMVQSYKREGKICYRYPTKSRPECILTNGSKIRWFSSHNKGKRLVGNNWILAVFAEAAHIPDLHVVYHDQVAPILSKSNGQVVFQATHHEDNDEFDTICQLAEKEEGVLMPDGRYKWHLITVTPRDYMTRKEEWELMMKSSDDIPALARHFYQKRGCPSTHNSIIGQWLQKIEYQTNILDRQHPVYCVWDIGGACNTSIWLVQHPHNFVTRITGNRKSDPYQSTLYYLQKVKDYLGDCPHVIHILPHDGDTLKGLDSTKTPKDYLMQVGENVKCMERCQSKQAAINNAIEYLRENEIVFDQEAREGVLELQCVKWKMVGGVQSDEPQRCKELDTFDSFIYAVLLIAGRYEATLRWLAEAYCPSYLWPGAERPEYNWQPILVQNGGKVTCLVR